MDRDEPAKVGSLAEAVGILTNLGRDRMENALAMLRDFNNPGRRYVDGQILYSSAYLGDDVNDAQERLPV